MSRIDDLVNGIYPLEDSNDSNTICKRVGFRQGYEQALKDAMQWLTDHLKNYIDYDKDGSIGNFDDDALLEGFDRAMR